MQIEFLLATGAVEGAVASVWIDDLMIVGFGGNEGVGGEGGAGGAGGAGGDTESEPDTDEDGVPDAEDNHPCMYNDDQAPIENDPLGTSCIDGAEPTGGDGGGGDTGFDQR